jgi:hypothetical protein
VTWHKNAREAFEAICRQADGPQKKVALLKRFGRLLTGQRGFSDHDMSGWTCEDLELEIDHVLPGRPAKKAELTKQQKIDAINKNVSDRMNAAVAKLLK